MFYFYLPGDGTREMNRCKKICVYLYIYIFCGSGELKKEIFFIKIISIFNPL